jgi:hypothetical protein
MKKLLLALAGVSAFALPAAANAQAIVTPGAPILAVPGNNDFQAQLAALGLTQYTSTGATITLTQPSTLTFTFLGSESALNDTFTGGTVSFTETSNFTAWTSQLLGSDVFGAGSLAGSLLFSGGVPSPITVGDPGFGIFLGPNLQGSGPVTTFYLGYDDTITGDDNHDDFIVRVDVAPAVPEPATWAMMLTGFAAAGVALRRRRRTTALAQIA